MGYAGRSDKDAAEKINCLVVTSSSNMTLSQFLLNLFFAGLSAFLGVLLGVWWAKREWARDRESQRRLLRANLVKAFRFNLERLEQCLDYLQKDPPIIPNFRLDTATVIHILFTGRGLFADESMFDRFSWQRYQLEHINAKLDYLHSYLPSAVETQDQTGLAQSAYDGLLQHLRVTRKDITALIADYEKVA
jgi:hypothetical protein